MSKIHKLIIYCDDKPKKSLFDVALAPANILELKLEIYQTNCPYIASMFKQPNNTLKKLSVSFF